MSDSNSSTSFASRKSSNQLRNGGAKYAADVRKLLYGAHASFAEPGILSNGRSIERNKRVELVKIGGI